MTETHARRLWKLARFLDDLPPEKFDLGQWAKFDRAGGPVCPTAACACGWAGTFPEFQALGYTLARDAIRRFGTIVFRPVAEIDRATVARPDIHPSGWTADGHRWALTDRSAPPSYWLDGYANRAFFGLSSVEEAHLFYPLYYRAGVKNGDLDTDGPIVPPAVVAARIRETAGAHFPDGVPDGPLS